MWLQEFKEMLGTFLKKILRLAIAFSQTSGLRHDSSLLDAQ